MSTSRTLQLWQLLAGLYGSALKAKFGQDPPAEWDLALSYLGDAQLHQGMASLVKSGKPHPPSLPEFLALCHGAREWAMDASRSVESPKFTKWEIEANHHLLAFVLKCAARKQYFDEPATRILLEHKRAWVEDRQVDDIGAGVPVEQQMREWDGVMEAALNRINAP